MLPSGSAIIRYLSISIIETYSKAHALSKNEAASSIVRALTSSTSRGRCFEREPGTKVRFTTAVARIADRSSENQGLRHSSSDYKAQQLTKLMTRNYAKRVVTRG